MSRCEITVMVEVDADDEKITKPLKRVFLYMNGIFIPIRSLPFGLLYERRHVEEKKEEKKHHGSYQRAPRAQHNTNN